MKINRILTAAIGLVIAASATAQDQTVSPYSRYGYGLLSDNATSTQRAMGGVGYAMNSGRQINVMNPASYAAIDSLTFLFDMGANLDLMWASEDGKSEDNISGGLDYITMAFPISRRVGASVGLLPYTSTGYDFSSTITNGKSNFGGAGNINQVYAGVSVNPFANLYVGANFGYLFGTTSNETYAITNSSNVSLFQRNMRVKDWTASIGAQYPVQIGKSSRVTLGLTYSPAKDLHGETYGLYYDASNDSKGDTIGFTKLNGKYSMPATYGGGINYMWRDRLMVEADFTYQPWKDAKYAPLEEFEDTRFDNRWKVAVGMQYTPMPRGSYMQRTQYRFGAYFNHDYLMVRGNNVREYGVTAGFGFPVPMFKTIINLGIEYKHRQAHPDPLLKENYLGFTLGVNFNEMWFRKSKIY